MKTLLKIAVLIVAWLQVGAASAASGISFDGPKITDGKIMRPGQFSVYQFVGTDKVDAAVPAVRHLWGLDNKNNWPSTTPNTYFDQHPVTDGDFNHHAVAGEFSGNATKDIVTADAMNLHFFYDYNGSAAGGESGNVPAMIDDKTQLTIMAIGVADFNADGKDDVAVIGYEAKKWEGYLAIYTGTNAGGVTPVNTVPYYAQLLKNGIPYSLAIGNFGGDGKPDVVVATMTANESLPDGAFGNSFINTGSGFNYTDHSFKFEQKECKRPTGLLTYNPDGAGQDDLLLTCYDRYETGCSGGGDAVAAAPAEGDRRLATCYAIYGSGPVVSLQNSGAGTAFATKQVIGLDADPTKTLNFPYTSTVGDYNGDGQLDLAVASNIGQSVITFAGTSPFNVDVATRNDISTLSYLPKYIQTHDMNGDGLPDLILTTAPKEFPVPPPPPSVELAPFNPGYYDYATFNRGVLTNGGVYSAKFDADFLGTANNFTEYSSARLYSAEGNNYQYNYNPNAEGSYNHVLILNDSYRANWAVDVPSYDGPPEQEKPTDGVLVLINHRPVVSGDDPKCGGGEVTYRCTAPEGGTIAECTGSTADSGVTFTPAVPEAGNKVWTGKVKLPNDKGVHKWTVTAKDNLGTVSTGEFTADFSNCPGTTACPAKPIEKQLSPKDAVILCAFENDQKLAELNSGKVVTWTQVGEGKDIDMSSLTVQGQCLVGPRLPLSFDKTRTIELKYSVAPDGPNDCPARFVYPKAFFEGSGSLFGCSLQAAADTGATAALSLAWLLPALGFGWVRLRRR